MGWRCLLWEMGKAWEVSKGLTPSFLSVQLQAAAPSLVLQCSFAESGTKDDKRWGAFLRVTCASKMSAPQFLVARPVGCSRQEPGVGFQVTLHCDWRDPGFCIHTLGPGDFLMRCGAGPGKGHAAEKRGGRGPARLWRRSFCLADSTGSRWWLSSCREVFPASWGRLGMG